MRSDGYFVLNGLSPLEESFSLRLNEMLAYSEFDPSNVEDARRRIASSIVQRQGQGQFRAKLLNAYRGRCAFTGCDVASALEAAHIVSYKGQETNLEQNGLLLRADVHTLFDLGLIAIDSSNMTVVLSSSLASTHYSSLAGKQMALPTEQGFIPSREALDMHRKASRL